MNLEQVLNLLKQRRVWAGLVFVLALVVKGIDVPVVTDLLTAFGGSLAQAIMAGLALWSYLAPKN